MGFAPFLDVPVEIARVSARGNQTSGASSRSTAREELIGTWYSHSVDVPDGSKFVTGVSATNPYWHVDGRWFSDGSQEAVAGAGLAQRLGLHPGSAVTVGAGDRTQTLTISGIVSTGGR